MTGVVEVTTTVASREEADSLARRLVESRMAACCQVSGPITSTYYWQGKIERAEEFVVRLKAASAKAGELVDLLRDLHPYDVPEILVTAVTGGNQDYIDWVIRETSAQGADHE